MNTEIAGKQGPFYIASFDVATSNAGLTEYTIPYTPTNLTPYIIWASCSWYSGASSYSVTNLTISNVGSIRAFSSPPSSTAKPSNYITTPAFENGTITVKFYGNGTGNIKVMYSIPE